jgi:tRNA dimethylallyltransferase
VSVSKVTEKGLKLVVITGPTASGKSSVAVELALHFDGEIVNADSMQVYRGMDVGTAKLGASERRGVPHHLIDVVDPDAEFNAAAYHSLAMPLLRDITSRQKICFVVGGTGLYIKILLGGLLRCPPVDVELRKMLHQEYEEKGSPFLHKRLSVLDPASASRIHLNDKVRILRALEVIYLTRRRLSSMIQDHGFREKPFQPLKICLQMGREQLYHRINERCLRMVENGLVREVAELLSKGYSSGLKSMKALGYRHMVQYLEGAWDLDRATHQLQIDTRRYAKRQLTWFRADPEWVWLDAEDKDQVAKKIEGFLSVSKGGRE